MTKKQKAIQLDEADCERNESILAVGLSATYHTFTQQNPGYDPAGN